MNVLIQEIFSNLNKAKHTRNIEAVQAYQSLLDNINTLSQITTINIRTQAKILSQKLMIDAERGNDHKKRRQSNLIQEFVTPRLTLDNLMKLVPTEKMYGDMRQNMTFIKMQLANNNLRAVNADIRTCVKRKMEERKQNESNTDSRN